MRMRTRARSLARSLARVCVHLWESCVRARLSVRVRVEPEAGQPRSLSSYAYNICHAHYIEITIYGGEYRFALSHTRTHWLH